MKQLLITLILVFSLFGCANLPQNPSPPAPVQEITIGEKVNPDYPPTQSLAKFIDSILKGRSGFWVLNKVEERELGVVYDVTIVIEGQPARFLVGYKHDGTLVKAFNLPVEGVETQCDQHEQHHGGPRDRV